MEPKEPREEYIKEDQRMLNASKKSRKIVLTCFFHKP